jgi:transposase
MGQRNRELTQVFGYNGWIVKGISYEASDRSRVVPVAGYDVPQGVLAVVHVQRRWVARCSECHALCDKIHERLKPRRWKDLPWAGRPVVIEYAPIRVKCRRCGSHAEELLPWADRHHRATRRLEQHLALDAFSMPLLHVATKYGVSWGTVRRAEVAAIERWEATRPAVPLRFVGLDEKYLGRRNKLDDKFVTIVSNLETGEPVWIGFGRRQETVERWLGVLTPAQKAMIVLFAMDMHEPFRSAVRADEALAHAKVVHDPFHVLKRAGEAITEIRREVFFRAGPEMRGIGRGTRWLVLRAWEKCTEEQRAELRRLFSLNGKLARAYQIVDELREVLHAPDRATMEAGLHHILRRTERRANKPMRKLHDSLDRHFHEIVALGEHHPPTGRVEALNNNWETLVRRARGYRDLSYLLRKLRFMVVNPVRRQDGVRRFVALGLPVPITKATPLKAA